MTEVRVHLPDDVLELVADRAAAIVLAQLADREPAVSEFLTVREAAELLGSSRQRVYDLLSDGRLERDLDGSRVLVRRTDQRAHVWHRGSRSRSRTGVQT